MRRRGRPRHPDILTPREWEVLGLIREGLSNEEIAKRLSVSVDGVKFHVSEILSKLGVHDRLEAARWQPDKARPWWLAAAAPVVVWRRLNFGELSLALAGAVGVLIAAGVAVLIWGLLATRGGGPDTSLADRTRTAGPASVLLFDVRKGTATRLPVRRNLMLARWLKEGETFVAYDIGARAWKAFDLDGNDLRTLVKLPEETAPYITTHLYPSPDGKIALVLHGLPPEDGEPARALGITIFDLVSGTEKAFRGLPGVNANAVFSPDGQRLAYTNKNSERTSMILAKPDGTDSTALRSVTGAYDYVAAVQWSPDGLTLLIKAHYFGRVGASYELVDLFGATVWRTDVDRLTSVHWAGPGQLFVAQPEVAAENGGTREPKAWFVNVPSATEEPAVVDLAQTCCADFSPDGRYALFRANVEGAVPRGYVGGIRPGSARCSLVDIDTGTELIGVLSQEEDIDTGFCAIMDWTSDSRLALVSQGGN